MIFELFVYLLSMSGTPGPNTILSLSNASEKGLKKGLHLNYGMFFGVLFVTTLTYTLISFLSSYIPKLSFFLQILSIIYILYLSFKMYRKNITPSSKESGTFKDGFFMQLVNVKVLMLVVSTISTFILPKGYNYIEGYVISLSIPIMCFSTGVVWAVAGAILKDLYNKYKRQANIIFALSLLLIAIKNTITLIKSIA